MRIRRSGSLLVGALSAALLWWAGPGASLVEAAGGGACHLQGVANLTPPLGSAAGNFAYSFTGTLSSCQSNVAGAPTSGTVSAGIQVPETVTLTNISTGATTTGTVMYQEPIAQGTGSCGNSTTSGLAFAVWGDGKKTIVEYNTTGALAAVNLQGTVVAGMDLALVASSVPAGYSAPATYTIYSDEPVFQAGQQSFGALTFSPTTQDQNCVTLGVSSANIDGAIGIGSP